MVRTWRTLLPLVITKWSVIPSRSPTSRTTVESAVFDEAAPAATNTQSGLNATRRPFGRADRSELRQHVAHNRTHPGVRTGASRGGSSGHRVQAAFAD